MKSSPNLKYYRIGIFKLLPIFVTTVTVTEIIKTIKHEIL